MPPRTALVRPSWVVPAIVPAVVVAVAVGLVAGCASAPSSGTSPPSNHAPGPAAGDRAARAIALLHALADTIRDDRSIGPFVDPVVGAWLWGQPGVVAVPSARVEAGDTRRFSEVLERADTPSLSSVWRADLAHALDTGLAVLDVDGDPAAPAYGVSCEGGAVRPAARALLRTHGVDLARAHAFGLDGSPQATAPAAPLGFVFVYGGVEVYLSERDGRLAVADVIVSTPCEA